MSHYESLILKTNPESWLFQDIRERIEQLVTRSGDQKSLITYYEKWLIKNPDDLGAIIRLADSFSIEQQFAKAEPLLRKAIARAPSEASPRVALVNALLGDDRFNEAESEMRQLVDAQPRNRDYLVRWGEIVSNNADKPLDRRNAEATLIWRRLLDIGATDAATFVLVADLFSGIGFTEEAIDLHRQAVKLAPELPDYRESSLVSLNAACQLRPKIEDRLLLSLWLREDREFAAALQQVELAESEQQVIAALDANDDDIIGRLQRIYFSGRVVTQAASRENLHKEFLARLWLTLRLNSRIATELTDRIAGSLDAALSEERSLALNPMVALLAQECLQHSSLKAIGLKSVEKLARLATESRQLDRAAVLKRAIERTNEAGDPSSQTSQLSGSQHWIACAEWQSALSGSIDFGQGGWQAIDESGIVLEAPNRASYLMLRYPLSGDFSLELLVENEYRMAGIGLGGVTLAPVTSQQLVRLFGTSGRSVVNTAGKSIADLPRIPFRIERSGGVSKFAVGQEQPKIDFLPSAGFLHLYCAGSSGVKFSNFQWQGDLTIANDVALLDRQLRLWTATAGAASLPPLAIDAPQGTVTVTNTDSAVSVQWSTNSDLELKANRVAPNSNVGSACLSLLRPLCCGEQLEYEFFYSPGQHMVHPVLGRLGFMLDENGIALHWMANSADCKFLGLSPENRVSVDPKLLISKPNLIPDTWNNVRLRIDQDFVSIAINNSEVAEIALDRDSNRQFGFLFDPDRHSLRVRNVILSGDWPKQIPINELMGKPK